jgi:hypothetical protein
MSYKCVLSGINQRDVTSYPPTARERDVLRGLLTHRHRSPSTLPNPSLVSALSTIFAPFLVVLALAALAYTQSYDYNISSSPLNLVVSSDDLKLDGDTLSACHTGVMTEFLCLSHSDNGELEPAVLYHNRTMDAITNVSFSSHLYPSRPIPQQS